MKRRRFLVLSTLSLSLAGCTEGNFGGPETATPECWPSMCAGTRLVEVVNSSSDLVTVQPDCRDTDYELQPRDSVEITREEDAESCRVRLSIGDKEEYREQVEGHESVTLTVLANGEVSAERIVV